MTTPTKEHGSTTTVHRQMFLYLSKRSIHDYNIHHTTTTTTTNTTTTFTTTTYNTTT